MAKRYEEAKTFSRNAAFWSGNSITALSSASLGTTLTGVGVVASIPLGNIAGLCGIASVVTTAVGKKPQAKVSKQLREIVDAGLDKA